MREIGFLKGCLEVSAGSPLADDEKLAGVKSSLLSVIKLSSAQGAWNRICAWSAGTPSESAKFPIHTTN